VKEALTAPDETVTDGGTVRKEALLVSVTAVAAEAAAPRVTVQVVLDPDSTLEGLQLTADIAGAGDPLLATVKSPDAPVK